MTNDKKLRNNNYFIDNLKVILIFLVVFGHLIERYIDTNSTFANIELPLTAPVVSFVVMLTFEAMVTFAPFVVE